MKRLAEAIGWFSARGVEAGFAQKGHGIEGLWDDGRRQYSFRIDPNFDSGFEMAVVPAPGRATWWIHAQAIDEVLKLCADAQSDVDSGQAGSWLDALKARDSNRWMDPDHESDPE